MFLVKIECKNSKEVVLDSSFMLSSICIMKNMEGCSINDSMDGWAVY